MRTPAIVALRGAVATGRDVPSERYGAFIDGLELDDIGNDPRLAVFGSGGRRPGVLWAGPGSKFGLRGSDGCSAFGAGSSDALASSSRSFASIFAILFDVL